MQTYCADVEFEEQPMGCDLSPAAPLIAVGLITGQLAVHNYKYEAGAEAPITSSSAFVIEAHKEACRAARFNTDGRQVVSGGGDRCIRAYDVETQKMAWSQDGAHEAGVSMLRVFPPPGAAGQQGPGLVVSGDEDGGVKVWDTRTRKQVLSYRKHTDFISDAALHAGEGAVVVTSGDGTLSVHDLRSGRFRARSETDADDELLACVVVKGGRKVVAGTQSGVLAIYSWGYFNDCSDRFPGHPESVDAVVGFDEDTVLTGSSDGLVRVVGVLPNKLVGVLGAHGGEGLPIERMALAADRRVLASTSHDNIIKLWDLTILHEDDDEGEEEGEEEGQGAGSDGWEEVSGGGEGEEGSEGSESESDSDGEEEGEEGDSEAEEGSEEGEGEQAQVGAGVGKEVKRAQGVKVAAGVGAGGKGSKGSKKEVEAEAEEEEELKGDGDTEGGAGGDDNDDSDDSDDSDAGGRKRKAHKERERTKWTKGKNQKPKSNFFQDLL